jgi:hypothetical protein
MVVVSYPVISKIVRLLRSDALEKQMAAALVLAELRPRHKDVVDGLLALFENPVPALQRSALGALAAIGAPRALPHALACHFAEPGHALGEELLTAVAESAGRTKIGKMARAKLKSSAI